LSKTPQKNTRKQRHAATIHDVAERAGVSPMTVSRVVNGGKNVRESTRAAVMAAVGDLHYAPNTAARSLAGAEGARVGLLYSNPSVSFMSEVLIGALDESSRQGALLVLEKCAIGDAAGELAAARKLTAGGVTGVILPSPLCEHPAIVAEFTQAGVPIVAIAAGFANGEMSCVRIDDFKAARDMTRYLLSLGHRRIGFIKGQQGTTSSNERQRGFEAALREAGIGEAPMAQGCFNYRSGLEAAEKLLAQRPAPTAIFASNDDMAAATVSVAHRMGLDVPGDLSVVGFDDTAIAATIWPELTTIRQPITDMARVAIDLVLASIRAREAGGEAGPVDHLVLHSLIERQSAAPPAMIA